MSKIDWSKAGVRLRTSPKQFGRNVDWNDAAQRWKTAEEYAGEEFSPDAVIAAVACPYCDAYVARACFDHAGRIMDGPHAQRRFAAGAAMIAAGWKL